MSAHRFFLETPLDGAHVAARVALPLASADVHHLANVVRVRPGEIVEVVEPDGETGWSARVETVGETIEATLLGSLITVRRPRVTLVQGVAKGDKMDAIVRSAVEIGAAEIVPVLTARSVVRLDDRKRAERGSRWRRIAKSAAEQSHRDSVPLVHDPVPLGDALATLAGYDEVVVLWEDARGTGLSSAVERWVTYPEARVALVVGPEGGLTAEEVASLEAIGATAVTLGPNILRTETAALVALALVTWGLGGLGSLDG